MEIKTTTTDANILSCCEVLKVLRPHLEYSSFVPTIRKMMEEGYVLAFIENEGTAEAANGFRLLRKLYNGKQYYIDDLATLPSPGERGSAANYSILSSV
jgi:hypothetical protein